MLQSNSLRLWETLVKQNDVMLVEYVRRLEEAQHIFSTDPAIINQVIKKQQGSWQHKLLARAKALDDTNQLQEKIAAWSFQIQYLRWSLYGLWFALGVFSANQLMQTPSLNFFYLLLSLLGVNALMLVWWCVSMASQRQQSGFLSHCLSWYKPKHQGMQSVWLEYRQQQALQPRQKWFWSSVSHGLWCMSLSGMLLGMLLMLFVRQYTFNWQSTLLDSQTLATWVGVLAYVPSLLGLDVPDWQAVAGSEQVGQRVFSKQWANLLWSSLLLYGVLPRLLAWLWCQFQHKRQTPEALPLDLPYYQRLKRLFSVQIIDSDADYQADAVAVRSNASAVPSNAVVMVAAWEVLPQHITWHSQSAQALNMGVIDTREEQAQLLQHLKQKPTHLHVWVRVHSMPDRGVLRRLNELADAAKAGLTVHLWQNHEDAERLRLWQQALNEQALVWQHESEGV